jgi:hypothetical protein
MMHIPSQQSEMRLMKIPYRIQQQIHPSFSEDLEIEHSNYVIYGKSHRCPALVVNLTIF